MGKRKLRFCAVDVTIIALGSDVVCFRIYLNWFGEKPEETELYDNQNCFSLLNNFSEEIAISKKNTSDLVSPVYIYFQSPITILRVTIPNPNTLFLIRNKCKI